MNNAIAASCLYNTVLRYPASQPRAQTTQKNKWSGNFCISNLFCHYRDSFTHYILPYGNFHHSYSCSKNIKIENISVPSHLFFTCCGHKQGGGGGGESTSEDILGMCAYSVQYSILKD